MPVPSDGVIEPTCAEPVDGSVWGIILNSTSLSDSVPDFNVTAEECLQGQSLFPSDILATLTEECCDLCVDSVRVLVFVPLQVAVRQFPHLIWNSCAGGLRVLQPQPLYARVLHDGRVDKLYRWVILALSSVHHFYARESSITTSGRFWTRCIHLR